MLSVTLVDFHDAMETVLDAAKLISLHPLVSDKLKVVEAELNDAEIQDIWANLDELLSLAQTPHPEALPAKGEVLNSSFVKVYL